MTNYFCSLRETDDKRNMHKKLSLEMLLVVIQYKARNLMSSLIQYYGM